uniref:Uncharacterized protein n=1 Tax=Arion vulgaris TaxID=1028688 RepID=A0A0B7B078_9EUPU
MTSHSKDIIHHDISQQRHHTTWHFTAKKSYMTSYSKKSYDMTGILQTKKSYDIFLPTLDKKKQYMIFKYSLSEQNEL